MDNSTRLHVPINLHTAPLLTVLILLMSECIGRQQVRNGVLGTDGVQPLDVMALFISLAYMTISIDHTGLLQYLAFLVVRRSSNTGRTLYTSLCVLSFFLALIIGNDPVIVSGAPFLAYLGRQLSIDPPTAWVFGMFITANVGSTVLGSSNPTDIILSGACGISYFNYSAKVILPTLASAFVIYSVLLLQFRHDKYIPRRIQPLEVNSRSALRGRWVGIFGSIVLVVTLAALVGSSIRHAMVCMITVPPAILVLARDLGKDLSGWWGERKKKGILKRDEEVKMERLVERNRQRGKLVAEEASVQGHPTQDPTPPPDQTTPRASEGIEISPNDPLRSFSIYIRFPTVLPILLSLPISLVLFSLATFVLVESLVSTGWIEVWSRWWGAYTEKTGIVGAVFGMGLLGCVGCNIFGTNIGTTLLLSRLLQAWIHTASPDHRVVQAAVFTLALASNLGAFSLFFPASLAGLLWRRLLVEKGVRIGRREFVRWNLGPVILGMVVGGAAVLGEALLLYRG